MLTDEELKKRISEQINKPLNCFWLLFKEHVKADDWSDQGWDDLIEKTRMMREKFNNSKYSKEIAVCFLGLAEEYCKNEVKNKDDREKKRM